jgi:hypothetical protein
MNDLAPAVTDLIALARRDARAAELVFNAVPREAQLALVEQAPAGERMRLLLLAEDCAPLVRALAAPALAQTAAAAGDDADVLARYASAEQLAAAIDIDCRRDGRIRHGRFRRWIALLVAASEREAAAALPLLDARLLAVGLRPYVHIADGVAERERLERFRGGIPVVLVDDLDSDDEDVCAFLRLLDEAAPQALSELGALLIEEDAEESANEDYAAHEERMDAIGLKDYARAAEVYGSVTPSPDPDAGTGLILDGDLAFLRQALAALVARDDCDVALVERLSVAMAELANDVAIADGAGADQQAALGARAKAERLVAIGLRRLSGAEIERAAGLLATTAPRDLLRAGL